MYAVLRYIRNHISEKLTLDNLADHFGYSKWYFCRHFKDFSGISITEYIRSTRIQLAAQALLDGKKVIDAAGCFGYDSVSGFCKAFLKEFGCYPQDYKKEEIQYQKQYEERRMHMTTITDRVAILKEAAITQKYSNLMFAQRDFWFNQGVLSCPEEADRMTLISTGIEAVLTGIKPLIFPGELIVGYNFPDGDKEHSSNCNDDAIRQMRHSTLLTEAETEWLLNNRKQAGARLAAPKSDKSKRIWGVDMIWETSGERDMLEDGSAHSYIMTCNHTVLGYELVLKLGVRGILEKIENYRQKNGDSSFYAGCNRVWKAFPLFITRYAGEAARLALAEEEPVRKAEQEQIAADCAHLSQNPPATFRQAIQCVWFCHILNTFEDGINANSVGRLDQILYPFYRHDMEAGILTKEDAFELLCCLWIKLYRGYDVQQSAVGGTNPDGTSAVNELSYLMLDVTEQLDFVRCMSVRYSSKTDPAFVQRALEVVGHVQKGVPFFFCDDALIPALENAGISHDDACDYTQIGCVETVIPGKNNPHAVTARCNLLKCLEYAFGNGHSMTQPELFPGTATGNLADFKTFDAFLIAVKAQIAHMIEQTTAILSRSRARGWLKPKPVKSVLTFGCLESGKDFNEGGALYDTYQMMLLGVPNLADSLMVIKEYVFRSKSLTLAVMKQILEDNFPDEVQRLEWVNRVPKYGNDMEEVDALAADIIDFACDCMEQSGKKHQISLHAQPFTFLWMFDFGKTTAATPDGRRKGEIMAYSMSPMQGRDFNGFTALINSLCKLPTKRTPGTTSAIVEVDPHLFTAKNLPRFTQIMLAAAEMGLSNIQFNITDADTLIDAQKHPQCHRNLAVRVSGFSQRFEYLDKPMQDHIIARTKHRTM